MAVSMVVKRLSAKLAKDGALKEALQACRDKLEMLYVMADPQCVAHRQIMKYFTFIFVFYSIIYPAVLPQAD